MLQLDCVAAKVLQRTMVLQSEAHGPHLLSSFMQPSVAAGHADDVRPGVPVAASEALAASQVMPAKWV